MRSVLVLALAFAAAACGDNIKPSVPPEGDANPPVANGFVPPGPRPPPDNIRRVSTPELTVLAVTGTSVTLEVCAGKTGMPTGYELQWGGCRASWDTPFASFACAEVTIGRLFDADPLVAYTCDELRCGSDYVFRAFAHETRFLHESEYSAGLPVTTLACYPQANCTRGQGYWKNHAEWPLAGVALGKTMYPQADLLAVFTTPARGNGLLILAHQLAAARLNIAAGADATDATTAISKADLMIGNAVAPPIGDGYLAPAITSDLADTLADYNEGAIGPGHCTE